MFNEDKLLMDSTNERKGGNIYEGILEDKIKWQLVQVRNVGEHYTVSAGRHSFLKMSKLLVKNDETRGR